MGTLMQELSLKKYSVLTTRPCSRGIQQWLKSVHVVNAQTMLVEQMKSVHIIVGYQQLTRAQK